jgi:hypothetical protein
MKSLIAPVELLAKPIDILTYHKYFIFAVIHKHDLGDNFQAVSVGFPTLLIQLWSVLIDIKGFANNFNCLIS